jgi:hypothetical protein
MVYNNDERLDMLKWLDRILELGAVDYMDAISFHIYTSPNTPEASPSKTVVVDDIRTILEKYDCADMPIRITEIGYSSDKAVDINGAVSGDYSELQQAMYSLRDLAMLYDKNLEAIQFYNAIEKQDGDSEQDNFGLINTWTDDYVYNASGVAYSAKPVFVSLVNFNTILSNAVLESKKQIKDGNYVYKFITKNEGEVYMLWNSKDMSSVEVLNISSDLVYVYDMYGNSRILRSTSQNYTKDISGEPTYVVVPKNTLYIPCDSLGNHLDYIIGDTLYIKSGDTNIDSNAIIIIAAYSDNSLMRTWVYTYADVLNETLTFDVTDCDTVGIFTLNDLNTLTPVNKKFEIKR